MRGNVEVLGMKTKLLVFLSIAIILMTMGIAAANERDIDVKPGSFPNSINLKSNGVLPVGLFGNATPGFELDVNEVDPDTLRLGPANPPSYGPYDATPLRWAIEDINEDGVDDMILHFKVKAIGIEGHHTHLVLIGELYDGATFSDGTTTFFAIDSIRPLVKP
ncbi:hypothetical protein [Methanococcoides methylutens]|nr:hypothetical protein [Methanococcoides methylutens]